uniref:Uncharacterized protein n=1 Tax=Avena sativa TaxID=4498 RepID=A0ACD5UJT2_AVESA
MSPTNPNRFFLLSLYKLQPPTRQGNLIHSSAHSSKANATRSSLIRKRRETPSKQASWSLVGRSSAHALVRKPMATVAGSGGAVLQLRVPSSSSLPARQQQRRAPSIRCGAAMPARSAGGGVEEDHYRTLRLAPGASSREVKKAFRRLALQYHPDVLSPGRDEDDDVDFQRINEAYQRVMSNMREAEARLEYWRARYGLADEDLDRYRRYLHEDDQDDCVSPPPVLLWGKGMQNYVQGSNSCTTYLEQFIFRREYRNIRGVLIETVAQDRLHRFL